MGLWASFKKKIWRKKIFLHPYSQWRKESDPELDPDPIVRGTETGIRIRTELSRNPNTAAPDNYIRSTGNLTDLERYLFRQKSVWLILKFWAVKLNVKHKFVTIRKQRVTFYL